MDFAQLANLRDDVNELKTQRRELRQLNAYREADNARMQQSVMGSQQRLQHAMNELENSRSREAKLAEDGGVMGARIETLSDELQRVNTLNEELKQASALNEQIVKEKDAQILTLRRRVEDLEAKLAEEQRQREEDRLSWEGEVRQLRRENQVLRWNSKVDVSSDEGAPNIDFTKRKELPGDVEPAKRASKKARS